MNLQQRRLDRLFILLLILFFPFMEGKGQPPACNSFFSPDTLSIPCGDTALLDPIVGSSLIGDDFNDSTLNSGWSSNQTVTFTDSLDCLTDPVNDGSVFAWMGNSATQPRSFETSKLNVACGGQICFDFVMASENTSGDPCEGPDQPDEGIALQWSDDGGNTWNDIFYFNPDTNGTGGDPSSPLVKWKNYCFNVPDTAHTDTTKFRWYQDAGSGIDFDHWGLDNVYVIGGACDSGALKYSYDGGANYMKDPDTLVNPANDTAYNLFITDTNYTDTCYADVFVDVSKPNANAFVDDSLICDNDSTGLHATDSCTYSLQMFDSFGTSWSGAQVVVDINNSNIGSFQVSSGGSNTVQFKVAEGDSLSIQYVSGFSDDQNTYELYDGNGTLVFQDGPSPTIGISYIDSNVTDCGYDFSYPNYSPEWSPSDSLSSAAVDNPTAFPDTTTEYVITYKSSGNSKCNVYDTTQLVVEPWGGNTTFQYSSGSYCYDAADQSVTIKGVKGGIFYSSPSGLDLDSSTGLIDVQNSAADSSYTVFYKTPGTKCSFVDSVPITIDTNLKADFHYADTTYCENAAPVNPTFLNNGSQGTFTANDPGLALDSVYGTVDVKASDTGIYEVYNQIAASGSCPADADTAEIVIENKPTVAAGSNDTICEGDSLTLNGSYSGGSTQSTWSSLGDGNFDDPNDTNATYGPGSSDINNGTVQLVIESDSIKACNIERDTMELVIKPAPSLNVSIDDTICVQAAADVSANVSGTASGVEWGSTGDGFFDDQLASSTVYHPGSADKDQGSVQLYAKAQGTGVCKQVVDSHELVLQPMADPTFSYPRSSYCVSPDSSVAPDIKGDTGGVFTADPPGGLAIDSSTGEIDLSASYDDLYDVTYTVGDRCPSDTTIKMEVKPQPEMPTPAPFSVCPKRTDTLRVTSKADSVVWYGTSDADNAVAIDSVYRPDASEHEEPGVYSYYVQTYIDGCPSELKSVDVTVNDSANVVVNPDPDPAEGIKPFDVTFTNVSGKNVVDYTLAFGKGMSVDRNTWQDTMVTYNESGKYRVQVSAIDSVTGCFGKTQLLVDVTSEPKASLPNVFTPNGDGRNEEFAPKLNVPCPEKKDAKGTCWNGIAEFKGTIFNRWGNKVYQWSEWNNAWSGTDASAGTYYYVIDATGENGANKTYKGQVTLMRDEK